MSLFIPKENKKVNLQPKHENPVIVPTRMKNYLVAENAEIEALEIESEPQIYRKIILGR